MPQLNQFTASLWGDEAFSAILSQKSIPQILSIISKDTSPPLYNITEHIAFQLFGTSELTIRGLSFFYYLLAIFFVYKIATYFWGRRFGVISSIITFLNPFFFIYAFEGRMYSILALGVAASMYFFVTRKWVLYVVASVWALYSHHFALFALFVQGLWFLYEIIKNKKVAAKMLISFIAIFVLYLPWLPVFYNQTKMVTSGFWLGKPSLEDFKNVIYDYFAKGINNPLSNYALYIVFATLLLRKWRSKLSSTLFIVTWFIVPIAVTWLLSQKIQSIFYNRYLLYTIPALGIVLSSNGRKYLHILLTGALIGIFFVIDINYFNYPTKRPFSELATYVIENKRGDDYLINWNSSAHHLWESKYYKIPAPIYIPQEGTLPYYVGTALMEESDIIHKIPAKGVYRVGVITSGDPKDVNIPNYPNKDIRNFGELKFIWLNK